MKLWIRSQNKSRFIEANMLDYCYSGKNHCIDCNGHFFGSYESKKRCLEIIDEIHKLLLSDFAIFNNSMSINDVKEAIKQNGGVICFNNNAKLEYHSASTIVYEMPQE